MSKQDRSSEAAGEEIQTGSEQNSTENSADGSGRDTRHETSHKEHHGHNHAGHGDDKGGKHECCGKHGHKPGHGGHGRGKAEHREGEHKHGKTAGIHTDTVSSEGKTGIEAELEAEKAKTLEYVDLAQRYKAEFENYKRRTEAEKTKIFDFAKGNLIAQILEPLDNFERAIESSKVNEDFEGLLKGVEIINARIREVLVAEGLTEIDPRDGKFDPAKHEAVMAVESPDHEDEDVVEVFQKGYEFKDRVLRHAKVQVAKKK